MVEADTYIRDTFKRKGELEHEERRNNMVQEQNNQTGKGKRGFKSVESDTSNSRELIRNSQRAVRAVRA